MRNAEVAESLPGIASSLLNITGIEREEVAALKVHEMGVAVLGQLPDQGASFNSDGTFTEWGGAKARSFNWSDNHQLNAINHLHRPGVIRIDPISRMEKEEAIKRSLGALVRISESTKVEELGWLGKKVLGRSIKKAAKMIIGQTFEVDIVGVPAGFVERHGPLRGTNPEYISEHRDSFRTLLPFFDKERQERITQTLGLPTATSHLNP